MTTFRDHFQELTNSIVAQLEQGHRPWIRPWDAGVAAGPMAPINPTTGKRYRGINTLILGMNPLPFQSGDPRWCSYKQAQQRGWQVRRGEKSTTVFFFKKLEAKDTEGADSGDERPAARLIPMLRSYNVFHASQIEGPAPYVAATLAEAAWLKPEAAQVILVNSGAVVRIGGERAFYSPSTDHIQLPPEEAFHGPRDWAATMLHELGHWTGHGSRLNRDLRQRFGSRAYAQEELRAELASVFIGADLGLPCDIPNHASYVASWITTLRDDKREIFRAARDAQLIADYVLPLHPDFRREVTPVEPDAPAPAMVSVPRAKPSGRVGLEP